ncbi:peptidyl-prolyl cis-trans isomerase FKBP13, chloroplastic [Olea europaea var. sylvestris]|uniref:peptidylprolyl isomerase n=1 Tax=Olea europaea subsp. europaea TaxID=158383 RepID=A0A8S0SJM1_OLEEU|nr:peptidyl-prolyl cis-trans isomerase FKBP13, chloroplastic [Olea europaea var. sylvestris]XP_022855537.1 peptidyl-prolyl cis-trans isomerase FKBP13, chloroplastic [Olea europaea var. sylvestris]CAA2992173.1 peptidyl-prolyl cis-trans isomerase FKBP13, chloroplastic [Olea europaea subsp. europaea]
MNSLLFSLGIRSPTHHKPSITILNSHTVESSSIKIPNPQYKSQSVPVIENPNLLSRREALGIGFSFGILQFLSQPHPASADESASCEFTVTPSGLAYCDQVVGYGPQAVKGQLIKAHYVGKLEDGKVFDSSYNRGKPISFRIGVGEVIKGWDQGILGVDGVPAMLAGGKRKLRIPPELGYGMRGAGCKGGTCIIPPDSVLLFDVEFIGKA